MALKTSNAEALVLKALHVPGKPVIFANIWDIPSLHSLLALNTPTSQPVKAVATASYAIAASLGLKDEELSLEQNLDAVRRIAPLCRAAGLPLTADLQDGYEERIGQVVTAAIEAGAVGANIEDAKPPAITDRGMEGLYGLEEQVARLKVAKAAAEQAGCADFVINARSDIFRLDDHEELTDEVRMKEAIARVKAFLGAGATTVFFWSGSGRKLSKSQVETLVRELQGRVSVKLGQGPEALSTAELAHIGVARVSVGPSLYQEAMRAMQRSAKKILEGGRLE